MSDAKTQVSVFCSYAEKDERLLQELEVHLSGLRRQGLISTWHSRKILPGADWAQTTDAQLARASVILLLVSPDYLASDHCYEIEMQRAVERHEAGQARVLPIVVRPCDWTHTPFGGLQYLPLDGKPVTTWDNRDLAWTDVVTGIRRSIEDLSLLSVNTPQVAQSSVWNIPFARNPFFTGREELLKQLHTQLQRTQAAAVSQPQAISGLGGIVRHEVT